MTTEEVLEALKPWRDRMRRTAWKPETVEDGEGLSHFGGLPMMLKDEEWPSCRECRKPMRLLLQLDLSALPEGVEKPAESGLLQLFYCQTDDGMCETWATLSECNHVRLIPGGTPTENGDVEPFAVKTITGWTPLEDDPGGGDQELNGLHYQYDFEEGVIALECKDPDLILSGIPIKTHIEDEVGAPAEGDKLAGWPMWVQGPEYPKCPECRQTMHYFFQIDSEDNVPHMFGDVGCGHITYCKRHPNVMAFGWACG